MLEAFALLVLFVLCAFAIWLVVVVGRIPGNMARAANHPQAEAINMLAWVGLLTAGVGWFVALVWAKTVPAPTVESLEARVAALEARLGSAADEP